MKKIKLFGDLQKFKSSWDLLSIPPAKLYGPSKPTGRDFYALVMQATTRLFWWTKIIPDLTRQITDVNAAHPWANEILVVVPRAGGDYGVGELIVTAIAGAAYAATAAGVAIAVVVDIVVLVSVSLAVSAIANVMTNKKGKIAAKDTESYESKPSFVSNGPVNVTRAGHPFPIIAGRFLCGSVVLSSQIHVKDIPV